MAVTREQKWDTAEIPLATPLLKRLYAADNSKDVIMTNTIAHQYTNPDRVIVERRASFNTAQTLTSAHTSSPAYSLIASNALLSSATPTLLALAKDNSSTSTVRLMQLQSGAWATLSTFATTAALGAPSAVTTLGPTRLTEGFSGTTPAVFFRLEDQGSGDNRGFYYPQGGSITEITDVDFPATASMGEFAYVDGYLFILTSDGRIYNSDLNDVTAWDGSYITTNFRPDAGVTIARYKNKVVAFGTNSMEFFEIVGTASGTPLQRNVELSQAIGIGQSISGTVTGFERAHLVTNNTIFWIANLDGQRGTAIYYLDNFTPVKLTTVEHETVFADDPLVTIAGLIQYGNTPYLVVTTVGNALYLISLTTKLMHKWTLFGDTDAAAANLQFVGLGNDLYINYSNQTIHKLPFTRDSSTWSNANSWQDISTAYTTTIQLPKLNLGTTKRKRLNKLSLKNHIGASVSVSWSDDDGATFSTARTLASGQVLSQCGAFRERIFKFTTASTEPFSASGVELQYTKFSS